jgi:hypothetical protein
VRYLVDRGAEIDVADATGLTPIDAALGRVGGHDRGMSIEVFADTAQLLTDLCAQQRDCDLAAPQSPPQRANRK